MRILVYGIALAGAAWHIALIVQRPVAIFAPTWLGPFPIAPARAADPAPRFSLVIVGTAIALTARRRIARNASVVGIAVAMAVTLR